jgi:hypothetical protein
MTDTSSMFGSIFRFPPPISSKADNTFLLSSTPSDAGGVCDSGKIVLFLCPIWMRCSPVGSAPSLLLRFRELAVLIGKIKLGRRGTLDGRRSCRTSSEISSEGSTWEHSAVEREAADTVESHGCCNVPYGSTWRINETRDLGSLLTHLSDRLC